MTNRSDEWQKMLDDFLVKIYEKSGEGITYVAREDIASDLGLTEIQQNNIVKELEERDYVATGEIVGTKIRLTDYGRHYVLGLELDKHEF